jgi:hypothetical protein
MTTFTCKECGEPVIVEEDGTKTRTCEHKDAVILANLVSSVFGMAKLENS